MRFYIAWDWYSKYPIPYRDCYTHRILVTANQSMMKSCSTVLLCRIGAAPEVKESATYLSSNIRFETINVLTRFSTGRNTPVGDTVDDAFKVIDCNIKANEPQALDALAVPLSTLELLQKQKYYQFCQFILAIKDNDSNSGFYEGEDELFRRRHPSILELQQIVMPQNILGRLSTMVHHHKLARYPGVTQIHATLQLAYQWAQMAANVTSAIWDCVHYSENWVCLGKQNNFQKLFPSFEPQESVAIKTLGLQSKSQYGV